MWHKIKSAQNCADFALADEYMFLLLFVLSTLYYFVWGVCLHWV